MLIAPVLECEICDMYFCSRCIENKEGLYYNKSLSKLGSLKCKHIPLSKYSSMPKELKPLNRHIRKLTLEKLTFKHSCTRDT